MTTNVNLRKTDPWTAHQQLKQMLRDSPELSNAEIARRTGYSNTWVSEVRQKVADEPEKRRRGRLSFASKGMYEALVEFSEAMSSANDWPDTNSERIALVNVVVKARELISRVEGDE